jgi:hypothetical protein
MVSLKNQAYVLGVVLISCLLGAHVSAFSFDVEATREECFYETVPQGDSVGVMFQVTKGGFLDIDIQV